MRDSTDASALQRNIATPPCTCTCGDVDPHLWSPTATFFSWRTRALLRGHTSRLRSASFSPDGRRIVTAALQAIRRGEPVGQGGPVTLPGQHTCRSAEKRLGDVKTGD